MDYTIGNYKDNIDIVEEFNFQAKPVGKDVLRSGPIKISRDDEVYKEIPTLAAACIGRDNTKIPIDENLKFPHFWTDIDAQEHYLMCKPQNYIIFGKPGIGAYALGESLAHKYKCIHICPYKIMKDEMEHKSLTGRTIDYNIRHNRPVTYDYIFDLMKMKLKSPAVVHRGYVITGLPLISSSKGPKEYMRELYSEDSVQMTEELFEELTSDLKRKKHRNKVVHLTASGTSVSSEGGQEEALEEAVEEAEEMGEEDTESKEYIPKYDLEPCFNIFLGKKGYIITKKSLILNQTTELFRLPMNPDLIIYITCPDEDTVTIRKHKRINYKNDSCLIVPFEKVPPLNDLRWPSKYSIGDYFSEFIDEPGVTVDHSAKYQCRRPINFRKHILAQMSNYKTYFLPYIENKIQEFNPNCIIKLDGRTSTHFMMHTIQEKLLLTSLKPVLVPVPLKEMMGATDQNDDMEDEEGFDNIEDFWINVSNMAPISIGNLKFNLRPSLWYTRCPVELKYGRSISGQVKYAVTFFNNVYLLSSLQAQVDFCKNPRPFLKLQFLKPTCRVMVIGTKHSGKTMVSECLSWLFDGKVIDYGIFYESELKKKTELFHKSVLSELMPTIEDARLNDWTETESQRVTDLDQWLDDTYALVCKYAPLLAAKEGQQSDEGEVEEYKFSFMNDYHECQEILSNKLLLMDYAPEHLRYPGDKPCAPAIGDEDVTNSILKYIEENNVQSEMDPTPEELVLELTRIIADIDTHTQEVTNNEQKFGRWIIDGFPPSPEYWDELLNMKLMPDYIICILENREIDPDLLDIYKNIEVAKKVHSTRFGLVKDPLVTTQILIKSIPKNPDENDLTAESYYLLNNLMENAMTISEKKDLDNENVDGKTKQEIDSMNESLDKFRESWDSLKIMLESYQKPYMCIEIQDKSDTQILEEVLLKLRSTYCLRCNANEEEDIDDQEEEIELGESPKVTNRFLGETGIYCPIEYFQHGVLWQGKPEFSVKYNNKTIYFTTEENMTKFSEDPTKQLHLCKPFKSLPPLRICIIGCIGSGRSTVSKHIAKELGLIHADFSLLVNKLLVPPHYKKVGRQFENIFLDKPFDDETVTEFQNNEEEEEFKFEKVNEETIRKIVYDYYEKGSPLPAPLLRKLLKKLWFEEPFLSSGIILDGFPRLTTDAEEMVASHTVPDLILELELELDSSLARLSPKMFKTWKEQLKEAKTRSNQRYEAAREVWQNIVMKNTVVKLMYNELENNVLSHFTEPAIEASVHSLITDADPMGLLNVDENLFNMYNEVIKEFPEPVNEDEWEKSDEAQERIDGRLEVLYEVDTGGLEGLKEILAEQRIKIMTIDGNGTLNKVLKQSLLNVSFLRNRGDSFFEQTFVVPMDDAESLLSQGHFFLSKFCRQCPVSIYENRSTIFNFFKAGRSKNAIYPVIHRSYIYFLAHLERMNKFHDDPLKYVTSKCIESFLPFPLRLGIIGAPKAGKSTLVARLENDYKLLPISRGLAIRHILDNMWWTELGQKIKKILFSGNSLPTDLIIRAVQTVAIDHRSMTQGFVFDGFPNTVSEAIHLMKIGLYPFIIVDLSSNGDIVINHASNDFFYNIKRLPAYSIPFTNHQYLLWSKTSYDIRKWIQDDYQNMYTIPAGETRWQCWARTQHFINEIVPKIHTYLNDVTRKAVSLDCMCISNNDFKNRSSSFRNFCPVCLGRSVLRHSNFPVERQGLIQYKGHFYWSCPEHKNLIMTNPKKHIIENNAVMPKDLPARITSYDLSMLHENGVCVVTYAEQLPAQKLIQGDPNCAVSYKGKVYLFCTSTCLRKFMETPHNFYDITTLKDINIFPQIFLKDLPDIGYLEQTVGNILTEACCHVNVVRPKYPGLGIEISGLLLIALFLKINNPLTKHNDNSPYFKSNEIFEARCKLAVRTGLLLRSRDNPFAEKYPKCCLAVKALDSGTVMKPSSFSYCSNSYDDGELSDSFSDY